ncbi:lysylphosphatidylglycerol synthase transmembrane domain-containing protein [Actinomadura sp. NEAU-AAG7]|uniref:lysylphosphatidylglycerol synthase transmembrane domain-containing protein n=1 Tax=Actinomadura sp. NEAU-AAG7 TaxID=2839640 RepID=UPI002032A380|nr:lysylphosphatidylglycerol synthase transmembrane domain-containing protein [Actinomadura sp. NEAU-AAG7]
MSRRYMARGLRPLAGLGILAALLWWHSTSAFTAALRAVDAPSIALALGIGLATTVLSAARWRAVARRLGLHLPLRRAVADYYRSQFLNAVLPAGVLGDVHRAVSHGHRERDVAGGVRAVVLERAAGQAVLLTAGAAVLLARPSLLPALGPAVVPGLAALGVLAGVLVVARRRSFDVRPVLDAWPLVTALSAGALAGHVTLFLVAARLAGATAPPADLVPLVLLALLVMALPINIGGWGPREAVLSLAFGAAGLGAERGLTVAVVYGVLAFVASLPGALALLLQDRQAPPERPDQVREDVPALAGRGQ